VDDKYQTYHQHYQRTNVYEISDVRYFSMNDDTTVSIKKYMENSGSLNYVIKDLVHRNSPF
jgi:hypothetical protein